MPAAPPTAPPGDTPPHRYTAALAAQIEARWQSHWSRHKTFQTPNPGEPGFDAARPKQFVLDMFPYPSGVGLHVGHPLGFIATDIYARYLRMTGHNVLHAMGFDAFGLPAEEYARETGAHPRITTEGNMATMRQQLRRLGLAHDERRGVATIDPAYYRWTQWIFLKIYNSWYDERNEPGAPATGAHPPGRARPIEELGPLLESGAVPTRSGRTWRELSEDERRAEVDAQRLVYLAEVPVNWCPRLGTVLANEEVTPEGRSERGNHPVFKRPLKQWMMRITAYAERLAADLDRLDWPESLKLMQRNWIGRSEGAFIDFPVEEKVQSSKFKVEIRVFTTRPDTLFGATYMVLSPEHPLVDQIAGESWPSPVPDSWRGRFPGAPAGGYATPREAIAAYRKFAASRSDIQRAEAKDKTGVFTGAWATNPATGKPIPVFIADYVLMGYGTGAIMAVPGQDERDWAFAESCELPIVRTVRPPDGWEGKAYTGDGPAQNSGFLDGLGVEAAKARMAQWLKDEGRGTPTVNYKLRDWLFSRQRYWGEPFPIVFDEAGRSHPLPESMLPVELPPLDDFSPHASDDPDAPPTPPLGKVTDWVNVTLDLGEGPRPYRRETNTMPNWAGSCWYYLRYLDPANDRAFCDPVVERYWMAGISPTQDPGLRAQDSRTGGVDLYVGGVEHAVLHLLYARFWHKVLFDLGYVSTPEPFQRLFNQGYIQAYAFQDERGVYVEASKVTLPDGSLAMENQDKPGPFTFEGRLVTREYGKMGKSLRNATAPDEISREYGCDTLRIYEMYMGPLEASKPWNPRDIVGAFRFLQRVWRALIDEQTGSPRLGDEPPSRDLLRALHKTIAGVRNDCERLAFNTAIAKLIEFMNNSLASLKAVPREVARAFVLMLAPLAPHLAEELWSRLGFGTGSLAYEPFPVADAALAADDEIELPVSINGKVRSHIRVPAGADAKAMEAAALAEPKVQELLAGKLVRKVIVVPKKMVNLVIG